MVPSLMEKEKRTDNKATLEVAGRDQQDQKIYLQFESGTLSVEIQ